MAGVVDEERGHRRRGAPAWSSQWRGRCSGMGRCTGVGVEEEERGAGNGGAGAVDGCAGNGGARRRGVVLRRHGGRGWRGVEMNLDNFNPRLFYTSISSLPVVSQN